MTEAKAKAHAARISNFFRVIYTRLARRAAHIAAVRAERVVRLREYSSRVQSLRDTTLRVEGVEGAEGFTPYKLIWLADSLLVTTARTPISNR